jgi:hypothetical protein
MGRDDDKRITPTTYHEAGHAIAVLALGQELRWVQIGPGVRGFTEWGDPLDKAGQEIGFDGFEMDLEHFGFRDERAQWALFHTIVVTLAGECAQRMYDAKSVKSWHLEDDRAELTKLLSAVQGDQKIKQRLKIVAKRHTKAIVKENWSNVDTLAKALLAKRSLSDDVLIRLTGAEIGALLGEITVVPIT